MCLTISEALNALGDTTEKVIATLKAKGIRGKMMSICDCPIARYLRDECGDPAITVGAYGAGTSKMDDVELPAPVRTFILQFDRGEHASLRLSNTPEYN